MKSVFLVKKYFNKLPSIGRIVNSPHIKIISTFTLRPGKTLYILDVMGEKILIALSKDNISMLTKLDVEEYEEDEDEPQEYENESKSTVKSKLKDRLRNYKGV